jgi:TonB-linked SusC/RagA family outer membrane protein
MRADGSSKFAEGNRWGYFPAGAIAWRISDEPFLANTKDWMDNLKLRLSIGTAGNDGIDASAFIDEWVSSLNDDGTFSYKPGSLKGNPDLTWEKTISRNIGLDYGFLNGKFNGSIDFYWNTTKDCLMRIPINSIAGYSYEFRNAAKTSNKGIEVSFNYNIIRKKDFDLNFGLTYNYNVNKVEEVPADANMDGSMRFASSSMNPSKPYIIEEGEPVGLIKGYKAAGFYTVDDFTVTDGVWTLKEGIADNKLTTYHGAENYKLADGQTAFPGMPKYEDSNADGVVNNDDATIIGRMAPKHTGGFNFNGRYKGLDFSANFAYQLDGKVFNANAARTVHSGNNTKWSSMSRLSTKFDNSWRMYNINAEGDLYAVTDPTELANLNAGAEYGLLSYIANDAPIVSDNYIESAAFLRLQSLTIGYTLPKQLISKIGISNARIYVTGGNLFCIKSYDGLDPDVNTNKSMDSNYDGFPTPGFDYNSYPKNRTFTFGLNVAF